MPDPANGGKLTRPEYDYHRDSYGNLLSIRDPLGNVTSYTYDPYNEPLSTTLPGGQSSSKQFDQFGRITRQTDFKGQVTVFQYDSLGRPAVTLLYTDAAHASAHLPSATITYTYDNQGRVASVNDTRDGLETLTYDAENRVASKTSPQGTISYAYDPATGKVSETTTAYTDVRYTYDALARLSTVTLVEANGVTLATPLVTSYAYTPSGNVASILQPNGVKTSTATTSGIASSRSGPPTARVRWSTSTITRSTPTAAASPPTNSSGSRGGPWTRRSSPGPTTPSAGWWARAPPT